MLCAVLYRATHRAVPCCTMLCAVLYRATHRAVPCRALCCTVLYHAVRCVVLCYTVLYCCTVLHRAVPCYSHTSPLEELQALQLLEEIGSGGHGTVFRGTLHGLEVAVKVGLAGMGPCSGGRCVAWRWQSRCVLLLLLCLCRPCCCCLLLVPALMPLLLPLLLPLL